MSTGAAHSKVKKAKLAGSVYFILLGLMNIINTTSGGRLHWKDAAILVLFCTPLLVNKKIYYLLFGGAAAALWLYGLYSVFNSHTLYIRGASEYNDPHISPALAFTVGYLFTAVSAFFSLLLVYAGTRPTEKSEP
jgi:hypothetical protein